LIRQYDIGRTVELTVLRNGAPTKISVELERSPRLRREMKKYRDDEFEFTARDISFFDIAEEQWDVGQRGVLVDEVKSGSWAELGTLSAGDLLMEVNGQPVDNVDAFRRVMAQVSAQKPGIVTMKVRRGIHTAFLEIEPNWKNQ
jgi:S1-C subfamily serine protease